MKITSSPGPATARRLLAMARQGLIRAHVQRFPLEEAMRAYELMEQGQLSGRAVMVP